ncbi:MAG: NADH-quinone oxidoreductase subunit N [Opitutales bacterium]|nr:NADH-quinone oxidoreductase subunit N [Opitutales bacterium]
MTATDLQAILPLIVLGSASLVLLLLLAFYRNQTVTAFATGGAFVLALVTLPFAAAPAPYVQEPLFVVDGFGLFFVALNLLGGIAVVILSHSYLGKYRMERGEFYVLLVLAVLGACVVALSRHFVSLFLGIELLSVSLYVMIGYVFTKERALEASVKYLFLSAAASAFLLLGMAFVYAATGSMVFGAGAVAATGAPAAATLYVVAGTGLFLAGIAFKLSLAPFHLWTPDVYQGAPAPVAAFLATVAKASLMAVLVRYFADGFTPETATLATVLIVLAAASMAVGNLLALLQSNLKRLLAYSSIAHAGYMMVALLAGGDAGREALAFYIAAYFAAALGAFGVIGYLSPADDERDDIARYRGLFRSRPVPAAALAVMLFSLIGLPLTAGFFAKLFVLSAGAGAGRWFLVLWLVANSAVGLYYYLRVVSVMCGQPGDDEEADAARESPPPHAVSVGILLGVLAAIVLWAGLAPQILLEWIADLSFFSLS